MRSVVLIPSDLEQGKVAGTVVLGGDVVKPKTVAKSLAIALGEVRGLGGTVELVLEDSVVEGMRLLARTEGIFTETAGAVTIAALEQAVRSGAISPDQATVGLGDSAPTHTIKARLEDAVEVLAREERRHECEGQGPDSASSPDEQTRRDLGGRERRPRADRRSRQPSPGLRERLLDGFGRSASLRHLYVNDEDVRFLDGLETELPDGRKCRSFRRSPAAEWSVP